MNTSDLDRNIVEATYAGIERRKVAPFGIYTLVCFEWAVTSAAAA
jgi:hypothetical protein